MNQTSLARLASVLRINGTLENWIVGGLIGILLPFFLCLAGFTLELLIQAQNANVQPRLQLGPWLSVSSSLIGADQSPLRGAVVLIGAMLLVVSLMALFLWFLYRAATMHSVLAITQLYRELSRKSQELAVVQSVSGQQAALRVAIQEQFPLLADGYMRLFRSIPRHIIQIVCCVGLSLLIDPVLTILGLTILGLLYRLYDWLEKRGRSRLPVLRERIKLFEDHLLELCETGPLLATVHSADAFDSSLESDLRSYREAAQSRALHGLWKTPLMTVATGLAICLFVFVLAIQIVDTQRHFSLASGLVLFATQLVAAASAIRLIRLRKNILDARLGAETVLKFLEQPIPTIPTEKTIKMPRLSQHVTLDHITLRDSTGKKLLEDISIRMRPGQLVSVVSSDHLQARAFAELLLGFGRPASGRLVFDDCLSTDIDLNSLQQQCIWIADDGPIVAGSIEENLRSGTQSHTIMPLSDAVRQAFVHDAIQEMSDGLSTMVTPHDGRLQADYLFRLGIARAMVRQPSIVVAEEPKARVKLAVETETLSALRNLTAQGMLVVVVPNRMSTLRDSDLVIVVHDHKIIANGKHTQLLETSELYRHFNYVRFSALRNVAIN